MLFQSTPPRGGRPRSNEPRQPVASFNPRPRVGGDTCDAEQLFHQCVSIHAPAWGATVGVVEDVVVKGVSIHAPAWGATMRTGRTRLLPRFQSTPPRGGRLGRNGPTMSYCVSIHAPAWGATTTSTPPFMQDPFQSTPPRGGRLIAGVGRSGGNAFQSTPPRGGRPGWYSAWAACSRFNPRPRVGGDTSSARPSGLNRVSIHAPAWGATITVAAPPPAP